MYKKIIYCLIFSLLFNINLSCQSIKDKNDNINTFAKVTKIDSTKSFYIISLKDNIGKAIFPIKKDCSSSSENKRIKVGKKYRFTLKKSFHIRPLGNIPKESSFEEIVEGKVIWNSNSNVIFYEDCLNMCGLNLYN